MREEPKFGTMRCGPEGNVLLPGSVFKEMENDIERLTNSESKNNYLYFLRYIMKKPNHI